MPEYSEIGSFNYTGAGADQVFSFQKEVEINEITLTGSGNVVAAIGIDGSSPIAGTNFIRNMIRCRLTTSIAILLPVNKKCLTLVFGVAGTTADYFATIRYRYV